MKPHFVIVMSANKKMQFQAEILLRSIVYYGKCLDFYCTIFILEGEKIDNQFIIKNADIKTYKREPKYKHPWTAAPRFNVKPKSDMCIHVDCDVIVCKDICEFLSYCQGEKICGVIADIHPFSSWVDIYKNFGLALNARYICRKSRIPCPFYVNNGVVAIPSGYVPQLRESIKQVIEKLGDDNYYIGQIATTIAIEILGLPVKEIPAKFNASSDEITDDIVFCHYVFSNHISSLRDVMNLNTNLKYKILELFNYL